MDSSLTPSKMSMKRSLKTPLKLPGSHTSTVLLMILLPKFLRVMAVSSGLARTTTVMFSPISSLKALDPLVS